MGSLFPKDYRIQKGSIKSHHLLKELRDYPKMSMREKEKYWRRELNAREPPDIRINLASEAMVMNSYEHDHLRSILSKDEMKIYHAREEDIRWFQNLLLRAHE